METKHIMLFTLFQPAPIPKLYLMIRQFHDVVLSTWPIAIIGTNMNTLQPFIPKPCVYNFGIAYACEHL